MKSKNLLISLGIAIVVVIVGFILYAERTDRQGIPEVAAALDFQNGSYSIDGSLVKLSKGMSVTPIEGASSSQKTVAYFGNKVVADFNTDGYDDVAFLLTVNEGGSGTFFYVVAALGSETGYRGTNAIMLGDRIAPDTTEFHGGKIVVNYADRLIDEPMTARPSVGISRQFHVSHGILIEDIVKK